MTDDLGKFIESQKSKLERERAELSRNGDFASTSRKEPSDLSPRGLIADKRRANQIPSSHTKTTGADVEDVGMPLGGYEKHQQKLREERKQEYIKFLAQKNFRSTGKVDPLNTTNDRPPVREEPPLKSIQKPSDPGSYDRDESTPPPRSSRRRMGKENWDDGDDYLESRAPRRRPVKKTSYEDLLQSKRREEQKYRGRFDDADMYDDLRAMKLSSRNYKSNSRSDGFLSHRKNEDLDDEDYFERRSRRRDRGIEPKHVRFNDEEEIDYSQWVKPRRRRLDDYDDADDDFDDLREWSQRRLRRSQRRSSAHEERRPRAPAVEDVKRTKTESEIRSQSAPLPEGTGIIGGREESKAIKLQKQEQYKKDLDKQRQEHEDMKRREKLERLGATPDANTGLHNTQHSRTPQSTTMKPEKQPPQSGRQLDYDLSPGNYGPSSRPPQHPSLYPNPYDDPYYYYGGLDRGAPQQPSVVGTSFGGTGSAAPVGTRYDGVPSLDLTPRSKGAPSQAPPRTQAHLHEDPTHQPPGGYSNIGAIGSTGSDEPDSVALQKKRAAQQAYQDELKRQMEERDRKKRQEKQDKERYEQKIEAEIAQYNPWGKGGAGAPLRDVTGHLVTDLRQMHQYNQEGTIVSPRDAPPPKDIRFDSQPNDIRYEAPPKDVRFDLPPEVNFYSPGQQGTEGPQGGVGASPFGRSDPLKEKQPQDDVKLKAKMEYQEYLKKQVEEKERKKKEEHDKIKREEELEEQRLEQQRIKMQKEYEEEQEKVRRKEEEVQKRNEELIVAQGAKKKEAERKRQEMEEKRAAELSRKLDAELAAKQAAGAGARTSSPPIPTLRAKLEGTDYADAARTASPPVPTLAKQQNKQDSPAPANKPIFLVSQDNRQQQDTDSDVLSQLTALRQQLKNEEQKIQSQIGRSAATTKYQQTGGRREESRRSRRDVDVFDRVLSNKPGPALPVARRNGENFAAADEFNKIKFEETSSLAGEFRSRFPQPVSSDSMLDLQQQEYLREQEDKISALKAGMGRTRQPGVHQGPSRSKSKESLLESDSQFIAFDGPAAIPSMSQVDLRPRQPSARERRRWKHLEEMAKESKPYDAYKPPTPGGFSLNSVTSFNVDDVTTKNEERLRRLDSIRRAEAGDPDQVLQQFMNEHRRPLTRASEASLEAETSFEPFPY